jgi:hypothetical protein
MPSESDLTELGAIRAYVTEHLKPLLPKGWRFESGIPTLDRTLSAPVVWIEYTGLAPLPDINPVIGVVAAQMDVCVATHLTDVRKGEAAADDALVDLYFALLAAKKFYSLSATKTVFEQTYTGWKVTVTVAANPKKIAPTEE